MPWILQPTDEITTWGRAKDVIREHAVGYLVVQGLSCHRFECFASCDFLLPSTFLLSLNPFL